MLFFDFCCDRMRQLRGGTLRYLKASLFILFLLLLVWYIVSALKKKVTPLYANGVVEQRVGELQYDFSTGIFVYTQNKKDYLQGIVSETLRSTFTIPCKANQNNDDYMCLHWIRYAKLEVVKQKNCHHVKWTPTSRDFIPHDCFSLRGAHWYGGSELYNQRWPLETAEVNVQHYLSNDILFRSNYDNLASKNSFGNVLERFWLNSNGVAVVVDSKVPLFVSINESRNNLLCFSSDYSNSPYPNSDGKIPMLQYSVCKEDDVKASFKYLQKRYIKTLEGMPDENLMKGIVWSTWGKFRTNMKQSILIPHVLNITNRMKPLKIEPNILEIHDPFSTAIGDFDFNAASFKNSHQMLSMFREKDFIITVTMTPFLSMNSKFFNSKSDFLILDSQGQTPSLVKWYYGLAGVVDITNPESLEWYTDQLLQMAKDYGIKSFHLYGCEANFLPKMHKSFQTMVNPGMYVTKFVSHVGQKLGGLVQTSCGYQTQMIPVYTTLAKRESHWGQMNGLKSIIPAVLTLGVLGYPFVVPDVIGGANYGMNMTQMMPSPDKELFIRWMQLATFLPVMKFSQTPWDYDDEVISIFENLMKIRKKKVVPLLLRGIREAEMTGTPIIRPIWWMSPKDPTALVIDSEFLVGDSLLVAPVLEEGATERDIYLPDGEWLDNLNNVKENGKQWLRNYKVNLNQVPVFTVTTDFG